MLTRRKFLKILAATCGSAFMGACARALPTSTPTPLPSPQALQIAALQPTETPTSVATSTPTLTAMPTTTATATATATATSTPALPDLMTIRGDQFFYRGTRFPVNGFNYYPKMHPWRTFNLTDWDPRGAEQELRLAVGLGANTVRTFIDYPFSLGENKTPQPSQVVLEPVKQYVANFREFLDIAGRLNLQVMVTLFDSMDWSIYRPENHAIAEQYLKALIPPFADDPRIMCWDLQNEPDRAIVIVGASSVISFFRRMSALVRQLDPRHLQTIGWIDRARARYFEDLESFLDFWTLHFYDKAERLNELVKFYKTKTTRPVLLQEFGLATGGPGPNGNNTEQDQAAHYKTVLTTLEQNNMCGSVFWTLMDFPQGLAGNPPSPNDSPENHFGVFRLDYSEKPVTAVIRDFWKPRREDYFNQIS
ncbi:MAG: cellulase family glycosylhydrolase [Chloroflexi bacterium]|nr:cellulase family glycosylhydrolase [Chloroflexota bacterium]